VRLNSLNLRKKITTERNFSTCITMNKVVG